MRAEQIRSIGDLSPFKPHQTLSVHMCLFDVVVEKSKCVVMASIPAQPVSFGIWVSYSFIFLTQGS